MAAHANGSHHAKAHWRPLLKSATPWRTVCFGMLTVEIRAAWLRGGNSWSTFTVETTPPAHTHTRTNDTNDSRRRMVFSLYGSNTFAFAWDHGHLLDYTAQSSATNGYNTRLTSTSPRKQKRKAAGSPLTAGNTFITAIDSKRPAWQSV